MPGETLLVGIATVAVALAGFTAVTSTLSPPGGSWSPTMRIRQRAVVSTSFNVVFESLAPLIVFAAIADTHAAVVIASAGVAASSYGAGGPTTRIAAALFALGPTATLLFWANAFVLGSVAIYALALCVQLSVAVISFYSLVSAAQGS